MRRTTPARCLRFGTAPRSPELTDSEETLQDGGRVYPVHAKTLETLLEKYRDSYPMESYAPENGAVCAAVVLYG